MTRHGMNRRSFLKCTAGVLAGSLLPWLTATAGPAGAQPGGFALRDVMWQFLPEDVMLAYAGPDDRLWRVVGINGLSLPPGEMKKEIEDQFARPSPQLRGARPALFETNGRVWFISMDGKYLLAYAGKAGSWIVKAADDGKPFVGNCPGHGRVRRAGHNVQLGNRLFFLDSNGVHCFFKGQWTCEKFTDLPYKHTGLEPYYELVPVKDGLAAFMARTAEPIYLWRAGQWSRLRLRELDPDTADNPQDGKPATVAGAAGLGDDLLVQLRDAKGCDLRLIPLSGPGSAPKDFDRLVRDLGAEKWAVRQKATDDLARLGSCVAKPVRDMLAKKDLDPEVRARLELVLDKVCGEQMELAGQQIGRVIGVQGAPDGTVLVAFASSYDVRYDDSKCGLIVIPPKGQPRVFRGPRYIEGWNPLHQEQSFPLFARDGRTVYVPGVYGAPMARSLDLVTGKLTELPDGNFCWLHAVMSDGTLLSSRRQGGDGIAPGIAVYRPGRADDRRIIQSTPVDSRGNYCIATDGAVWTFITGMGLCQFDGNSWRLRLGLEVSQFRPLAAYTPGTNGAVLVVLQAAGDQAKVPVLLWTGSEMLQGELFDFIKTNAPLIRRHFSEPRDNKYAQNNQVLADKAGNIWVRHIDGHVYVLAGDKWITFPSLPKPDNFDRTVRYITTLGRGEKVYCSTLNTKENGGLAYLAHIEGGQVRMDDAPCTGQYPIRLADGTVCLNGKSLTFLREDGRTDEVPGVGSVRCVDASGLIWTADGQDRRIHVVSPPSAGRKARLLASAQVPYPDAYSMQTTSDRARSAYVWSLSGLHHYVLDGKDKLRLVDTVHPRHGLSPLLQFSCSIRSLNYTPLGCFIIVSNESTGVNNSTSMHLVAVPKASEE